MGDRSNVTFHHEMSGVDHPINVYSHWGGTDAFIALRNIVNSDVAKDRYDDPSYFTRICVQNLLNAIVPPDRSTGAGLSPEPDDNSHTIIHVYVQQQRIRFGDDGNEMTYDEFVAVPDEVLNAL